MGWPVFGVHKANLDSAYRAVTERVLFVEDGARGFVLPPKPVVKLREEMNQYGQRVVTEFLSTHTPENMSYDEYILEALPRRRARYELARERILADISVLNKPYVDAFLKREKVDFSKKDPAHVFSMHIFL